MAKTPRKLFVLSTPVGPLGTGLGGGVELTLFNMAQVLEKRGYSLTVLAPQGSQLSPLTIETLPGALQDTAQSQGRQTPITLPPQSVLAAMCEMARQRQSQVDAIINFAYDWLPFYLTPFFEIPIFHFVSMGSLNDAMDEAVCQAVQSHPQRVTFYTRTQAETFGLDNHRGLYIPSGLDLSLYEFCDRPGTQLAWVGRIAPEKGLEDALAAISQTGDEMTVWGVMQCPDYWDEIRQRHPQAKVTYGGFLPTEALQKALGQCRGLIMTSKWVEAFGNVAIEALACGVPVVSYRRGGPAEIVRDGETGWLVEPDSVAGLVAGIEKLPQLSRSACRQQAEVEYSLAAMGDRLEQWLSQGSQIQE